MFSFVRKYFNITKSVWNEFRAFEFGARGCKTVKSRGRGDILGKRMCIPDCMWNVRNWRKIEGAKGRKLWLYNGIRTKSIMQFSVSQWD